MGPAYMHMAGQINSCNSMSTLMSTIPGNVNPYYLVRNRVMQGYLLQPGVTIAYSRRAIMALVHLLGKVSTGENFMQSPPRAAARHTPRQLLPSFNDYLREVKGP